MNDDDLVYFEDDEEEIFDRLHAEGWKPILDGEQIVTWILRESNWVDPNDRSSLGVTQVLTRYGSGTTGAWDHIVMISGENTIIQKEYPTLRSAYDASRRRSTYGYTARPINKAPLNPDNMGI
jgi:hypothetical protein